MGPAQQIGQITHSSGVYVRQPLTYLPPMFKFKFNEI